MNMKKIALFSALALCLAGFASCVEDKVYDVASVSEIKNTVAYTEDDAVTVTAKISALVEITKVELKYKAGSESEKTVAMTGSKNEYSGTIPAAAVGTKVVYHIEASTEGNTMCSQEVSYTVGEVPIDYTGLALNELNGNDKFIEIYNKGKEEIRIKGISLQKDGKDVWTAPSAILKPGEFILLYSTDVQADHAEHPADYFFGSGLSAKKAVKVELFDPKGSSLDCFNLVNFVKKASASYSRVPDGTGEWYFTSATPSAKNANETSDKVEGLE
ncbi:MAG TPA: hypothetical protein DDX40_06780 [Rikenellaceae bacterium]|nr:hypothetical protein [Rikenellaceae bacterium]